MSVTDASITRTTAANFIPQVWADGVLAAVEFSSMLQTRVVRDYEGEIASMGDTIHVPYLSNLTTQTKTAGVSNTIAFEAITEGKQDITVTTQEYAAFLIENIVEAQQNQDIRARYEKKIGYALARGREVTVANLFSTLSTNLVGTLGSELTSDDYLTAWTDLAVAGLLEASPDPTEDFSIFLSPAAYAAAMKIDIFINQDYNPEGNAIQRAQVGNIFGFPVYISNLLNSPSANQHNCAVFYKGAFALCVQAEIPVRSDWLIRNIADGVVGWNLYGKSVILYPPETPGGGTATDNRGVLLKTV